MKIAVEEHFVSPELERMIGSVGWDPAEWRGVLDRLAEFDGERLEEMDRLGIDVAVVALGSPGIQGVADPAEATAAAREANDVLAAKIAGAQPGRFAGFAAVAMQDPEGAAVEAERAVKELGMVGLMVNGYSDRTGTDGLYYDEEKFLPFWESLDALGVPFYLHPRNPQSGQRLFRGREELLGPVWGFAVETGTHALRLITSGLFDRFDNLQVILGHLGEQLPFAMARLDQRIAHNPRVKLHNSPREVFRERFYVTTSGNSHTASLVGILLELGSERVLFAADYPFEEMTDASVWFDQLPISTADKRLIGRENAARLLGIGERPLRGRRGLGI